MNTDAKGLLDTAQVDEARPATVGRSQRELTERRRRLEQSEQTLADSKGPEDPLRMMIDTIPTLAWSCRPDGTTEFLNQRWFDYTGIGMKLSGQCQRRFKEIVEGTHPFTEELSSRAAFACGFPH